MILKKKVSVGNCLKRKTMLVGVKEDMKKVGEILAKPAPEKRKTYHH